MSQGVTPKERFSMHLFDLSIQFLLGMLLILSSLGVILLKNPVHASLSFLVTLMTVAVFFLELSAEFIAVMQVLIYAGAILVIFIFLCEDVVFPFLLKPVLLPINLEPIICKTL